MIGTYVLSAGYYDAYYVRAQKIRTLIKRDFEEVYAAGVDAILTPATPSAAFAIGEKGSADPVEMYLNDIFTVTVNMAGLPGIAVPAGLDAQGLPLGLQLIGRAFDEETLFAAGQVIEEAAGRVAAAGALVDGVTAFRTRRRLASRRLRPAPRCSSPCSRLQGRPVGKVLLAAIAALAGSILLTWIVTAVGLPWIAPVSREGPLLIPVRAGAAVLWAAGRPTCAGASPDVPGKGPDLRSGPRRSRPTRRLLARCGGVGWPGPAGSASSPGGRGRALGGGGPWCSRRGGVAAVVEQEGQQTEGDHQTADQVGKCVRAARRVAVVRCRDLAFADGGVLVVEVRIAIHRHDDHLLDRFT